MKHGLVALIVGFTFALGLGISGMTQPTKVVGFLDLFGDWDPALAFVMIGAISVHFVVYRWVQRRSSPIFGDQWHIPNRTDLNGKLLTGAFIFGVGWGLAGYCPGPAVTALGSGAMEPVIFVISMVVGMMLFRLYDSRKKSV